jgi:hypothetical protein
MPALGGLAVLGDAPAYEGTAATAQADDPGRWLRAANAPGQDDLPPLPALASGK